MDAIELRIPPPLVAILVAAGMWLASYVLPAFDVGRAPRLALAALFVLAGAIGAILAFRAFGRAETTVDPVRIDRASALVTTGIYGLTRNPMYVGLALLLCGWASWLAAPWTIIGPVGFVAFVTRFQIVPEERMLLTRFGDGYAAYRRRVRRWL